MRRVLVSGATGFIGGNLVKELLKDESFTVTSIGRTDPKIPEVQHITFDFANDDMYDVGSVIGPEIFDVFYHTAWSGVNGSDKKDLSKQAENVDSAMAGVLIAFHTASKLVTLGSASEFSAGGLEITDSMTPAPLDVYGLSKSFTRSFEKVSAKEYGIGLVQTVVGSIYGPGRASGDALSYAINKLISGESPKLDSDGKQIWEFLFINDLVSALVEIGKKGRPGSNYVISSGERKSLGEFLSIAKQHVAGAENLDIFYGDQFGGSLTMDNSLLVEETGWKPRVPFEEGSQKLVEYLEHTSKENKTS